MGVQCCDTDPGFLCGHGNEAVSEADGCSLAAKREGKPSSLAPQFHIFRQEGKSVGKIIQNCQFLLGLGPLHQFGEDKACTADLFRIDQFSHHFVERFVLAEELNPDGGIYQYLIQGGRPCGGAPRLWR